MYQTVNNVPESVYLFYLFIYFVESKLYNNNGKLGLI